MGIDLVWLALLGLLWLAAWGLIAALARLEPRERVAAGERA